MSVMPRLSRISKKLYRLYNALAEARQKRGAIEFETVENQFIFNPQGRIERIEPLVRNDAHKLIEECMILANIASARFVEEANETSSIPYSRQAE